MNRLSGAEALHLRELSDLHKNIEKNFFDMAERCNDTSLSDTFNDLAREHQQFHKILSRHLHNSGY